MKTFHEFVGLKRTKVADEFEANLEALDGSGYFFLPFVFSTEELGEIRQKMDQIWDNQLKQYGGELLGEIGEQCFIGVNASLRDHIKIGEKCVIGAGALLLADVEPEGVYMSTATERSRVPSTKLRRS